jgi:hypothetical protein
MAKTLEASSFLYALIELLNEKGLLTIKELDERKKQVAQRLVRKFVESGMRLMYQDPEEDKYIFGKEPFVDCKSPFAYCTSPANPTVAAATEAALGVLTPMPCIHVTTTKMGAWLSKGSCCW